ncbi:hypothetical protein [Nocardioides mangrovi]|uniref:Uncharacterized protein n=1 Tax=Nocardioides mangrovi TaxID=2874580 RepID=A0ABS7U8D4_9ACTN|nr:hypothetical protein [Nocardioides mangrovi]MBZ5736917.1 hypothetical protein [Nocardioides mangrovi]
MAIEQTCPQCGSRTSNAVGQNIYLCDHEIVWYDTVMVPDVQRLIDGTPGDRPEQVRKSRTCGFRFGVSGIDPGAVCRGRLDDQPCGVFAAGICQGEDCGTPVCAEHGIMMGGGLLCERCTKLAIEARAAARAEDDRRLSEAQGALEPQLREQMHARFSETTTPDGLLSLLRDYAREVRREHGLNPFRDRHNEYRDEVVDAWARFVVAGVPGHEHELLTLRAYKVPKDGHGRPGAISRRERCWLQLRETSRTVKGDTLRGHEPIAYTASHAYIGRDALGHQEWSHWGGPPTLNGNYIVSAGVSPQWVKANGLAHLYQCWPVDHMRPINAEDVLSLVTMGHQALANRRGPDPYGFMQIMPTRH